MLQGMAKTDAWRDHVSKGAESFDLPAPSQSGRTIKAVFQASIMTDDGKSINREKLRNKTIAVLLISGSHTLPLIINGWHPVDVWRLMDSDVTDHPNEHSREGYLQPKIVFAGKMHHTRSQKTLVHATQDGP